MHIKKGDKVIVISGKDKGTVGTVEQVFPGEDRVLIDNVNVKKRHRKPRRQGEKVGQILEKSFPIHISNVQPVDPKTGKGTRVRHEMNGDKKVRVASRSGAKLD